MDMFKGCIIVTGELMVRLIGSFSESYRIKKLITVGYKLLAIVEVKTGYVLYFALHGRLASTRLRSSTTGRNEYARTETMSVTAEMIKCPVQKLTSTPHGARNAF